MAAQKRVRVEVVCSGSPRQMGWAQGATLQSKISEAIRLCSSQESFRLDQPRWMPDALYTWLAGLKAWRMLHRPLERDTPEMLQRIAGLAEGAQLSLRTLLLANAIEPFMSSVKSRCEVRPAAAACSAIAVRGRCSATGEPAIARNFDYLPFVQPYFALRENRPDRGHRSLDFTVATMAGTIDGLNEQGLAITYNYAYTVDDGPLAAPVSMVISSALERCSNVEDAARWIGAHSRWGGGILMLADASGDIASLELSSTRNRLRRPEPGQDLLFHTNEFQHPEMWPVEVSHSAVFTDRAHPVMRGRRVLASAEARSQRLAQLLRDRTALSGDDLSSILADHGPDDRPSETTLCVHGEFRSTAACLQLFPQSRRMRVDYDFACSTQFEDFAL